MRLEALNQSPAHGPPRCRDTIAAGRQQFPPRDAGAPAPPADARHYRRQAELCQRLLSALHQPDLVEMLGTLQERYEVAARIEARRESHAATMSATGDQQPSMPQPPPKRLLPAHAGEQQSQP